MKYFPVNKPHEIWFNRHFCGVPLTLHAAGAVPNGNSCSCVLQCEGPSSSAWTLATLTAIEPAVQNARKILGAGYQTCRNDLHSNSLIHTSVRAVANKSNQLKKKAVPTFPPHCMGKHLCKCTENQTRRVITKNHPRFFHLDQFSSLVHHNPTQKPKPAQYGTYWVVTGCFISAPVII